MYMIDEGKNLVVNKLYDFFMTPMNEGAVDIDTVSELDLDVGENITFYNTSFDAKYILYNIPLDIGWGSGDIYEYLICSSPYANNIGSSSVSYSSNAPRLQNLGCCYKYRVVTLALVGAIPVGLPYVRYNSTNIYYYNQAYWRILRIA